MSKKQMAAGATFQGRYQLEGRTKRLQGGRKRSACVWLLQHRTSIRERASIAPLH